MRPSAAYLICCCERTGSTLLGDALAATGIAGRPHSYFGRAALHNPRTRRLLREVDDDTYLDKVIAEATTPNGVFGAKVHWEHFLALIAKAERSAGAPKGEMSAAALRSALPGLRYVWLARNNEVARAISHYRARKTDRWHVDARWSTDDSAGEGEPDFDFAQINALVRQGREDTRRWQRFFAEHAITPLELSYEQMVVDLAASVRQVLEFLGLTADDIALLPPTLRRLADERSSEWEARYRRICADAGA